MLNGMGEHGQGSVTRRADGRLMVAVTMLDGRRVFRYVPKDRDRARQRRRAEALRRELVTVRERDLEPWTQTLGDYLRSWIEGLPDGRRPPRPRTIEHYRYIVDRYLIPGLGHVRLDRLSPRSVQAWVDRDTSRSAAHHYAVLRRALNVAKRQSIIGDNPATAIEPPEASDFRGEPLSVAEVAALYRATEGDRLHPLWRLAIDSGLRISELLGLSWDDLELGGNDADAANIKQPNRMDGLGDDLHGTSRRPTLAANRASGLRRDGGRLGDVAGGTDRAAPSLTVRHQLYRANGKWFLVPPKTKRDHPIHLAPSTAKALREHRARMAAERTPDWRYHGLVFVTPKGQPIARADVLRAFHAACDRAGIARRRVHDLRGTTAALLQDLNVAESVRMARLGHTTTRMARHYAGASEALDREAAMTLERVLG